jgi:ABC-type multidrug transport system ATPase subunit
MNAIEVEHLSKSYGENKALDDISFQVPSGSLFGLIGPNGAGKTTLFSLMANFIKPGAGNIRILGQSTQRYASLYSHVSVLPQDALLYKNRSIVSQLYFVAKLIGLNHREAKAEAQRVLELVHLQDKRHAKARELSHGMSKRVGIAQALIGSPKIILLDEPLAGLDPALASSIKELIQSLHRNRTIIISSHNLLEVQELCDHVAILSKGKVKACGRINEIMGHHNQIFYLINNFPNLNELKNHSYILECSFNDEDMKLFIKYDHEKISTEDLNTIIFKSLQQQNIGITSISTGNSLEYSFLNLI